MLLTCENINVNDIYKIITITKFSWLNKLYNFLVRFDFVINNINNDVLNEM
jgi:hypothetical protein